MSIFKGWSFFYVIYLAYLLSSEFLCDVFIVLLIEINKLRIVKLHGCAKVTNEMKYLFEPLISSVFFSNSDAILNLLVFV